MGMRILMTGAGGFLGRHLLPRLLAEGHAVTTAGRGAAPAGVVAHLRLDAAAPQAAWRAALAGQDALLHLAGIAHRRGTPAAEMLAVNRDWPLALGRAAAACGVGRMLFVGSIGVHGPGGAAPVTEASAFAPQTAYAEAKLAAERALRGALAGGPCALLVLRPPLVAGPGAPGNLARLRRLAATPWPLPFGALANRRSLLSVEGFGTAVAAALRRWQPGAYVLADAGPVSTAQIVAALREGMGRPARLFGLPPALLRRLAGAQLAGDLVVDAAAFARDFGWRAEASPLEALRRLGAEG